MRCKWDEIKSNPRQSDYSMADVLTPCHCERCKREREKDQELENLRKENSELKKKVEKKK